jgi:hypothetical protein
MIPEGLLFLSRDDWKKVVRKGLTFLEDHPIRPPMTLRNMLSLGHRLVASCLN